MKKQMLIIEACGIPGEAQECLNIKTQAELYGINVTHIKPQNNDELIGYLYNGSKYDYIYLSSHGNKACFGNEDNTVLFSWLDFGSSLCLSDCMNEDCIIMLSCCRGGLNQVSYTLFYCCDNISYIVGPRQSLCSSDMLISFNILLYNIEKRHIDPILACEKIKLGTDIRFVCFDRLEIETDVAYTTAFEKLRKEDEARYNAANEQNLVTPPELNELNIQN